MNCIFLVTWTLINVFMVPCDCNKPAFDDYGRETNSNITYAVACWDSEEISKSKKFDTYEEAREFVLNGQRSNQGNADIFDPGGTLKDFEIEKICKEDK